MVNGGEACNVSKLANKCEKQCHWLTLCRMMWNPYVTPICTKEALPMAIDQWRRGQFRHPWTSRSGDLFLHGRTNDSNPERTTIILDLFSILDVIMGAWVTLVEPLIRIEIENGKECVISMVVCHCPEHCTICWSCSYASYIIHCLRWHRCLRAKRSSWKSRHKQGIKLGRETLLLPTLHCCQ